MNSLLSEMGKVFRAYGQVQRIRCRPAGMRKVICFEWFVALLCTCTKSSQTYRRAVRHPSIAIRHKFKIVRKHVRLSARDYGGLPFEGGRSAFRCRTKWCGYPIARPEFFAAQNHPSRLKDDLAAQDQEPVAGGIARSRRPGGIENVACRCG